ncbi:hypothetical protein [Vallitalea guaymasensis]|uniref:hypothetical protein n=1 Tax=Vallitalea guaymasensis TaxID=1185412 RepID=UPI000DE1AFE1|nr:hypothetical protein [Vallitalea guaymasensis]
MNSMPTVEAIINSLKKIRTGVVIDEYKLQNTIARQFSKDEINFVRECTIGKRCRIDFFIPGGIGIEVKKGKPNRVTVLQQLGRYAESYKINCIILVVEKNLDVPSTINGKRCFSIGLNKQWGVAI